MHRKFGWRLPLPLKYITKLPLLFLQIQHSAPEQICRAPQSGLSLQKRRKHTKICSYSTAAPSSILSIDSRLICDRKTSTLNCQTPSLSQCRRGFKNRRPRWPGRSTGAETLRRSGYSAKPILAPTLRAINTMPTSKSTISTPSAQT